MPARDPIPTRSALLQEVRDPDNAQGWNEFERTYRGLIRRLALKAGLREDEADEVLREVLVGVQRGIGKFHYDRQRCSFKHWLTQLVRWRIRDRFRQRDPFGPDQVGLDFHLDDVQEEPALSAPADLESVWDDEWQRDQIERAADRLRQHVSERQYQMFYLHVVREMPVTEVVQHLRVGATQVYLNKFRVGPKFRRLLAEVMAADQQAEVQPR